MIFTMGFKENLKIELNYKDMTVKELAFASGVNKRTIDQYLSSAAKMPSAENAVKIAAALGVSVEYLVTGKNPTTQTQNLQEEVDQARCYKKYCSLIQKAERLTQPQLQAIEQIINLM